MKSNGMKTNNAQYLLFYAQGCEKNFGTADDSLLFEEQNKFMYDVLYPSLKLQWVNTLLENMNVLEMIKRFHDYICYAWT